MNYYQSEFQLIISGIFSYSTIRGISLPSSFRISTNLFLGCWGEMLDTKANTAQPQPSNLTSQSECNSNEVPLIDSRLDHSTVVPVINSIMLKYDFLFQIIESLCWCQVSNELVKYVFILNNN